MSLASLPSLSNTFKAGAYKSEAPFRFSILVQAPGLADKTVGLAGNARDQQFSLLWPLLITDIKSFITLSKSVLKFWFHGLVFFILVWYLWQLKLRVTVTPHLSDEGRSAKYWRYNTQHNDTQHNGIQLTSCIKFICLLRGFLYFMLLSKCVFTLIYVCKFKHGTLTEG